MLPLQAVVQLAEADPLTTWRYEASLSQLSRAWCGPLAGARVWDIGAYPGDLACLIRDRGAEVTAVSLVSDAAFEEKMAAHGIAIHVADIEAEPLPACDQTVDIVMCCEVLEHLDGDVDYMLAELRRVVRDSGVLLLTTPNHASVAHRWALMRGRSVYPELDNPVYPFYRGAGVRNPMRHVREFTVDEVKALLTRAGFSRVALTTISPPSRPSRALSFRGHLAHRLLHRAGRAIGNGGDLIVAVGRT
jgi:SAM-dependent methyltransferase